MLNLTLGPPRTPRARRATHPSPRMGVKWSRYPQRWHRGGGTMEGLQIHLSAAYRGVEGQDHPFYHGICHLLSFKMTNTTSGTFEGFLQPWNQSSVSRNFSSTTSIGSVVHPRYPIHRWDMDWMHLTRMYLPRYFTLVAFQGSKVGSLQATGINHGYSPGFSTPVPRLGYKYTLPR